MEVKQPREPIDWFRVVFQGLCGMVIGGLAAGLLVMDGSYAFSICERYGWPRPFILGGALVGGLYGAVRGWGP